MTDHSTWRPLRSLDVGREVCAHPSASVHHRGVLHRVYTEGDDRGLVDVRYPDGVLGAWPQGQVVLIRPALAGLLRREPQNRPGPRPLSFTSLLACGALLGGWPATVVAPPHHRRGRQAGRFHHLAHRPALLQRGDHGRLQVRVDLGALLRELGQPLRRLRRQHALPLRGHARHRSAGTRCALGYGRMARAGVAPAGLPGTERDQ